ncbi:hypothetical protein K457DRAFT_888217 [Linnemannia elongata AG-77]|uniref:F-box domain-containing protein n=1 Tax=Linnemannia elongata AG-77 TaxID=1314771 RepID=A0A197K510_9FUNG|nr:hypothetical protein K457DRAFT_888217 [Linnemannia elongata AG-77]
MSVPAPKQIPPELLTLIFDQLSTKDLYQCLLVSRLWHNQAQAHVYSNVTLDTTKRRHNQSLVLALKSRRHLLRKVEWRSGRLGSGAFEDDLLDIVLDYGPVVNTPAAAVTIPAINDLAADKGNTDNNTRKLGRGHPSRSLSRSFSRLASVFRSKSIQTTAAPATTAATAIDATTADIDAATATDVVAADPKPDVSTITRLMGPGPNRPTLQHFTFAADYLTGTLLETVLFNLTPTTLTTLEVYIKYAGPAQSYDVDIEMILEAYPCLKNLCLDGSVLRYTSRRRSEDSTVPSAFSANSTSASFTTGAAKEPEIFDIHQQHRLEAFTFGPNLLRREGADAFLFVKRLGNLKRIRVRSTTSYAECAPKSRPWDFGRALKAHCPKLESIDIDGPVVFWLFDLPILPYDQLPHITAMVQQSPSYLLAIPAELAQLLKDKRLRLQLMDEEQEELLEGKTAVSFFPQLKKLIVDGDHSLSVQDLFSLGVQGRFLTHLEILRPATRHTEPWEVYDKDDKNIDSAPTPTLLSAVGPRAIRMVEQRRLQLRRSFDSRDVILFLQLCSSLRFLSVTGCSVTSESLVDSYIAALTSATGSSTGQGGVGTPFIRPWACEDTLETLKIGLDVPPDYPKEHHATLWKYLGRFKKLRHLSLVPTLKPRWVLIPTFDHGVEGLFPEGGMSETLEKLELVATWWEASVGKEMVLWLAKSCPKLKDLNLEYHFLFSDFTTMDVRHRAFLEEEEVKKCSIKNIDVLSW